jgi:hypothetical protein
MEELVEKESRLTMEELVEAVFFLQSEPNLYREDSPAEELGMDTQAHSKVIS